MAQEGEVEALYGEVLQKMMNATREVRQKMKATPNAPYTGFRSVLEDLGKTLVSMEPMVREIDQPDPTFTRLLNELTELIPNMVKFRERVASFGPQYMKRLENINESLTFCVKGYVSALFSQLSRPNKDDEDEGNRAIELQELLTQIRGMIDAEIYNATKSTPVVFPTLKLTLKALYDQLFGELAGSTGISADLLLLLKKVKHLVQFHGVQHVIGMEIGEWLTESESDLRNHLPQHKRLLLDIQIQKLRREREREQWILRIIVIFFGIGIIRIFYDCIGKVEEWKDHGIYFTSMFPRAPLITPRSPELFDVFLSCRGDILKTHAAPLNEALQKVQLRTFYYGQRKNPGIRIERKLQVGVKNSLSAIVIFSREFATSNWCLDELVLILEREGTSYYPFIPIYCDGVTYQDLMLEKNSIYLKALENHKTKYGLQKVNKWAEALKDVGDRECKRAPRSKLELEIFFKQVAKEIKEEITPFIGAP